MLQIKEMPTFFWLKKSRSEKNGANSVLFNSGEHKKYSQQQYSLVMAEREKIQRETGAIICWYAIATKVVSREVGEMEYKGLLLSCPGEMTTTINGLSE
jgi:hypothetical protein